MPEKLPLVQIGQPITARGHNRLIEKVNTLGNITADPPLEILSLATGYHLRLSVQQEWHACELDENIGQADVDKAAHVLSYDGGAFVHSGDATGFDPWELTKVSDPHGTGVYLDGERVVAIFDRQTGKVIPTATPGPHVARVDAGGISALSGTTPGTGTVSLYSLVGGTLTDTTIDITANHLGAALAENDWVSIVFHRQSKSWFTVLGVSDDKFVAVDDTDAPNYLEEQFFQVDEGIYDGSFDFTISHDNEDAGAGDKKLRTFIDISDISSYAQSTKQWLIHDEDAGLSWAPLSSLCGPELGTGHVTAAFQVLGHAAGSDACSWIDVEECAPGGGGGGVGGGETELTVGLPTGGSSTMTAGTRIRNNREFC